MSKKRPSQLEPLWPFEATIALLAWLDHTLTQGLDFHATVIGYLKGRGHKAYRINQINNKLDRLWRKYKRSSSKETYREIFNQGSSCLPWLPAEESRALSELLNELQGKQSYEQSTRPREALGITVVAEAKSMETVQTGDSREEAISTPYGCIESSEPDWLGLSEHLQSSQDGRGRNQYSMSAGKRAKKHDSSDTVNKLEDGKQHGPLLYVNKKQFGVSDSFSSNGDSSSLESEYNFIGEKEDELNLIHSSDTFSSDKHYKRDTHNTSDVEDDVRVLRLNLSVRNAEIERLESSLRRNRAIRKDQERTIENLKSAQTRRDLVAGQTVESWICDKNEMIRKLTQERNDLRQLHIFTGLSESQPIYTKPSDIHNSIVQIRHQVKLILYNFDEDDPILNPDINQHKDLAQLVNILLGNTSQPISGVSYASLFLDLGPQPMVSGLTTTALKSWVFETDCPDLIFGRSLKLEKYQELLRLQGGPLALRNFDLAASRMMIDDYETQKLKIRRTAKHLAIRLSRTLAPFFQTQASGSQSCFFETWGQDKALSGERWSRLINIFELSLTLKLDLLISTCYYEYLIYPPGSPFDSQMMEVETREGIKANKPEEPGFQYYVELCLHAAILLHTRPPIAEASPMSDVIVQSKNFIQIGGQEKSGNGSLILKAVVILKKSLQEERPNEQNQQCTGILMDCRNDDDGSSSPLSSVSTWNSDRE